MEKILSLMSEFKPNANGKENRCISKPYKEQLTRYIQALSKTVTHTQHTNQHTQFFPSSNTLLLLYPSISSPVFLSAVGKLEQTRMCTTDPWPQGGNSEPKSACTHPSSMEAACSPGCPSRPFPRPSGPIW